MFEPTPAFYVSLLPIPFLLYMNVVVFRLLVQVRRETRSRKLRYPRVYRQGRALGYLSGLLAITPAIVEWRIFVLNPWWSLLYLIGGIVGVLALRMVREGLIIELRRLTKQKKRA